MLEEINGGASRGSRNLESLIHQPTMRAHNVETLKHRLKTWWLTVSYMPSIPTATESEPLIITLTLILTLSTNPSSNPNPNPNPKL